MNEIISALGQVLESAKEKASTVRGTPVDGPLLDYRAVLEMGVDHLKDTLTIFRHARKLKNQLEAVRKPPREPDPSGLSKRLHASASWRETCPHET